MQSKAKLFGHAIHPMLIVFPLGLFATAAIFDVIYYLTGTLGLATAAYWCIAAGIVGGLAAAVFGLWDWLAIPGGTRAKRLGAWHGIGNVIVAALFAVSWWVRRGDPSTPATMAVVLSAIAVGIALVTGWLGGEMVDQLGIGVREGANPDAPSSLREH
jgi:uncharacterized membrane protein